MKIHIVKNSFIHHKNKTSIMFTIKYLGMEIVDKLEDADVVYSPQRPVNNEDYPEKKFIFGPHFSVVPDEKILGINNVHNNAIFIVPSPQTASMWRDEYKVSNIPIVSYAFGVDTEKFNQIKPINQRNKVILYTKMRSPDDINYVKNILSKRGINVITFDYKSKYDENNYLNALQDAKYCIWIGCQESQGFGLQEALSCNVPLLVWTTNYVWQEHGCPKYYYNIKTELKTISYWDNKCGEYFYEKDEFESKLDKFIDNLDNYNPREFIVDDLSLEKRAEEFKVLLERTEWRK